MRATGNEQAVADAEAGQRDAPVFVVFGDRDTGERLASALREFGLRTRHAVSLEVFRNAAAATPPSAVVLDDALLPDTGPEADQGPRWAEHLPGAPPVIAVGRSPAVADRLRAVRAGADAWFTRPFNPAVLAHRLHQLRRPAHAPHPRLLAVDDTGALEETVAALAHKGLQLDRLDAPLSLLEHLEGQPPDMLLVSGDLDAVDAGELLQVLRQDPGHYGMPAVILTAGDKRRFDGLAARAGIDGVIGLPAPTDDLEAMIRSRLERVSRLQSSARYLARRDPETGLHSATHLLEELRQTLVQSREGDPRAALVYLHAAPADGGHDARVQRAVTIRVARQLQRLLPSASVAARLNRDQYAALVFGAGDRLLEDLSARIRDALDQQAPATRAALGVTLLGSGVASADEALERARRAAGAGTGRASTTDTTGAAPEPLATDWEAALRGALDQGRFRLVYQPIASLSGTPVSLYEVFIRMLDADGGEILPQEFLPAAEELGLTRELDRWILQRAVDVLAQQARRDHRPVLFLKLFPATVADTTFPRWLADRLHQQGVPGDRLVLQLTQEAAAARLAETTALAEALRPLGCALALEHYGARPDPNGLLEQIPWHYIKLSPKLTRTLEADPDLRGEVQALTSRARAQKTRTVAALIQDASSLSVLWAAGVDYIQGYFMQAPSDLFGAD